MIYLWSALGIAILAYFLWRIRKRSPLDAAQIRRRK